MPSFEDALAWGKQARRRAERPEVTAPSLSYLVGAPDSPKAPSATRERLPTTTRPCRRTMARRGQTWDDATGAFLAAARFAEADQFESRRLGKSGRGRPARWGRPDAPACTWRRAKATPWNGTEAPSGGFSKSRKARRGLAAYEALLAATPNPSVALRGFILAKRLEGDGPRARRYFEVAKGPSDGRSRRGDLPLGALARLYCEADVDLDEALHSPSATSSTSATPSASRPRRCSQAPSPRASGVWETDDERVKPKKGQGA